MPMVRVRKRRPLGSASAPHSGSHLGILLHPQGVHPSGHKKLPRVRARITHFTPDMVPHFLSPPPSDRLWAWMSVPWHLACPGAVHAEADSLVWLPGSGKDYPLGLLRRGKGYNGQLGIYGLGSFGG